jgi:hypothetical protein
VYVSASTLRANVSQCPPYTYCLPLSRFRSYAVLSRASDEQPVVARSWPGGETRIGGQAPHHEACDAMRSLLLPCAATGVSLRAVWCLRCATPRGPPWTPAVTLAHGCDGLRAPRMAVLGTCRAPSLCRHVRRELLRNAWLDVTLIIPATACHQRNDVGRYSRSKSVAAINHIAQKQVVQRAPCSRRDFPYEPSTRPPGG